MRNFSSVAFSRIATMIIIFSLTHSVGAHGTEAAKLTPVVAFLLFDSKPIELCREIKIREASNSFALGTGDPQFTQVEDKMFFVASTAQNNANIELWLTDGSTSGTRLVKDVRLGINAGLSNTGVGNFLTQVGNKLFFFANDGVTGFELWVSDGTAGGTSLVKDINAGNSGLIVADAIEYAGKFYFLTNGSDLTSVQDEGLWVSDGTALGTTLIKDVNLLSRNSVVSGDISNVRELMTVADGKLLFAANDNTSNAEPWISDGTALGTFKLADINTSDPQIAGSSFPDRFRTVGTSAYFVANDSSPSNAVGEEIFSYANGAVTLLKDINPGSGDSVPRAQVDPRTSKIFEAIDDQQFVFVARDGVNGDELWASDGSDIGTIRLTQIATGAEQRTFITSARMFDGYVYFNADDSGKNGNELWKTDGTVTGTELAFDLLSGPSSSSPEEITATDQFLFFEARDSDKRRLYAMDEEANLKAFSGAGDRLTAFEDELLFRRGRDLYKISCPM